MNISSPSFSPLPTGAAASLGNGQPVPPETARRLSAGPLSVDLIEGELRYFKTRNGEAVRRIYAAVRDGNWNTIAPKRTEPVIVEGGGGFEVTWENEHRDGDVDFVWTSRISGTAEGVIRWDFDGVARRSFAKNRVGFCILHPLPTCQGKPCTVEYLNGDTADRVFPDVIAPDQPVRGLHDFRKISYEVDAFWSVEVECEGDAFEMEDQRNWTDASFKTYSTPQRIPLPGRLREGQRVRQTVTVKLVSRSGTGSAETEVPPVEGIALQLAETAPLALPKIGLGSPSHGAVMSEREAALIKALRVDHLRVDVKTAQPDWQKVLRQGAAEAARLGAELEIALHLTEAAAAAEAAEVVAASGTRVARWLVIEEGRPVVSPALLQAARPLLSGTVGAGTDIDFFPLNNNRPAADSADFIFCSIRPQAHAFDDATVIENLEGQAHVTASAWKIFAPLPFVASPVTLKRRWHKGPPRPAHELPPIVDRRQRSLLGAGWLIGSLGALTGAGAVSVTWFETTGWRGIMETAEGAPLPEEFPSSPGTVFPMYHVFRALVDFRQGGVLRAVNVSQPLKVQAVALESGSGPEQRRLWMVANVTGEPQTVLFPARCRARVLDLPAADQAGQNPETFEGGEPVSVEAGPYTLTPWAVVFAEE